MSETDSISRNIERVAYSFDEAIVAAATNKHTLRAALNSGELPARKNGTKTVILAEDLRNWIASLPPYRGGQSAVKPKAAA